jgi:hypothetical protein
MRLYVHTLTGQDLPLDCDPAATVEQLKRKIAELYLYTFYQLRLVFGGKQLSDPVRLSAYGIRAESIVHMSARLGRVQEIKRSLFECSVCMEDLPPTSQCVLHPCGHSGVCSECSEGLESCPLCREAIQFLEQCK